MVRFTGSHQKTLSFNHIGPSLSILQKETNQFFATRIYL